MGFLEVLGLFVCFCGVSAVIDLGKEYARGKIVKATVKQSVDTAFGTAFRAVLKYKLARETRIPFVQPDRVKSDPTGMNEFDEHGNFRFGGENDEVSNLR